MIMTALIVTTPCGCETVGHGSTRAAREMLSQVLCAGVVATARGQDLQTPEDVSAVCTLLKGLTLGPDSLAKLG